MEQATAEQPSTGLRLGRHAVGIMVAALANPMIYFSTDQVLVWLATWGPVLIATTVIYGLLALFLTRRARAAWPGGAVIFPFSQSIRASDAFGAPRDRAS